MRRLAIFDLDGTLLDTVEDLANCTNHALSELGFPTHQTNEYYNFVGRGIDNLFRSALPADKATDSNVAAVRRLFIPYYNKHNEDYTKPYSGIAEVLETLASRGMQLAVASNKYQEAAEKLLHSIFPQIRFIKILGQRDGHPIKPDPDIVNTICDFAGINKSDTIYIGDSGVDMQTAINAGVTSVAVTWGFRSKDELLTYHPDFVAENPEDLPYIIHQSGKIAVSLHNAEAGNPSLRLKKPVDLNILEDEQIAICGQNGSGKTLLANMITGRYPILAGGRYFIRHKRDAIRAIAFRDSYGSVDATWCYQQRWNSTETEESPFISDIFPQIEDLEWKNELFKVFHLDSIWGKRLVSLSSGEMRKYQLAKALSLRPAMIVVDNPYIGLDPEARAELSELFERLIKEWSLQVVLIVPRKEEIPSFITHIIQIKDMGEITKYKKACYREDISKVDNILSEQIIEQISAMTGKDFGSDEVAKCNNVSLKYGDRTIFKDINWEVRKGEHWSLQGHNGAGKSALLSLIYADNPQAYACDISLFGRKRGTGESIWEIKKHIGYVSPEMHRSYCHHIPAIDILASGLNDTIGLYRKIHDEEREICRTWLHIFGLDEYEQRDFCTLSSGEQRMVLLARAFVKNPELLILDEPLHGLDNKSRNLARAIIKVYCSNPDKTLIAVTHYPEELDGLTDKVFRL